ncbi:MULTISPECIES: PKD domain-containing protein [Sorangium]|uniref:PKD domain-containing protein n=1 Tax=Sorangium TaxID=39643 RepID=UPI003D9C18FE
MKADTVKVRCLRLFSLTCLVLTGCADALDDPLHEAPATGRARQALVDPDATYLPGVSYFGTNRYIEYIPGDLPLIFTAPHGGDLEPSAIPDRTPETCGVPRVATVTDANTQEQARALQAAFYSRTGRYPHVIVNRLHRVKLDANRALAEAACGAPRAEAAWDDYHAFIEVAKARILRDHGKGWYTDLHGHGHEALRLELGFDMNGDALRHTDEELDADPTYEAGSTLRTFSEQSPISFSTLLRGPSSLGSIFANAGYDAVPSQSIPAPTVDQVFFSGGFNTVEHGCKDGGMICGAQIESWRVGVRDTAANRARFATTAVEVFDEFLSTNFGIHVPLDPQRAAEPGAFIVVDNDNAGNDLTRARFHAASSWSTTANNQQKHLGDFRLSSGDGPSSDGAEFFFYIGAPGVYDVDAWWPSASTRTEAASYRVFELDGGPMLADLTRSQRTDGGQWNSLGTFTFPHVGWAKVLISRYLSGPGSLAADAVRVTLVAAGDRAPIARIDPTPTVPEGSPVSLDAGHSFDFEGHSLTYTWRLGEGLTATGRSATHVYPDNGVYRVDLTVADPEGHTGAVSRLITVTNIAPTVNAGADVVITSGDVFALHASFEDPGIHDAPWSWEVDWTEATDSGATDDQAAGLPLSHRFCRAGEHLVRLTVTDKDGGAGADTVRVDVGRYRVGIDVQPSFFYLDGNPALQAAWNAVPITAHVLSTPAFDATRLRVDTVRLTNLAGSGTSVATLPGGHWHALPADINGDGRLDMALFFRRADLIASGDLTLDTTALHLVADAADCRQVLGSQPVRVIP